MKTLEDEWYVAIKTYKLAVFEILGDFLYCHILRVRAIPTLESTDSMISEMFTNEIIAALMKTLHHALYSADFCMLRNVY